MRTGDGQCGLSSVNTRTTASEGIGEDAACYDILYENREGPTSAPQRVNVAKWCVQTKQSVIPVYENVALWCI